MLGVCTCQEHRLPELVLKLTNEVAKKHPSKNIYLYGDDTMINLDIKSDNIKLLGTLTAEETADLYRKCELGVIFSTTNPSRIAFEMVACGTLQLKQIANTPNMIWIVMRLFV